MDTLEKILQIKKNNGISDAEFERALALKPKTVYDWKRGKSTTFLENIVKIASYFNVSTDYLLNNDNIKIY